MRGVCPVFTVVISLLFCASCSKQKNNDLIHSISDFSVPISCVASQGNDSIFWVGLENGDIVRINVINNSRRIINAGNNRIYDIYTDDDTTLFAGIRNEGVKRILDGTKPTVKKYYIPHPTDSTQDNTDSYAVYNIFNSKKGGDTLYFATSSGIYTLNKNDWEKDAILHPYYRPGNHSLYHFGVNQVFINDNGINIYAATSDSGLIVLDKRDSSNKKLTTEEILHFYKYNDSILYASSSNSIYEINMKQPREEQEAKPIKNDSHPIFAYMVDSLDGKRREWTLTSSEMRYKDKRGSGSLLLLNKLSASYKNYICKGKDFILVACHNNLYAFSLHQNPSGESNNVIAACVKEEENSVKICYFFTNKNELFSVGTSDPIAKPIGNLSLIKGEKPEKFYAGEKYLWLITNNSLYRINADNAKVSHEIGLKGSDAKKKLGNKIDFRSIHENKDLLFLGTRNYLLRVFYKDNKIERIDSIKTNKKAKVDYSDLYITDIDESGKYFTSLKHGIFKLESVKSDSLEKITGSDTIGEIRSFIGEDQKNIYLYTSKGVYELSKKTDTTNFSPYPEIKPKTILTIFYGTKQCYFIGYRGVEKRSLDTTFILHSIDKNLDLSINKAAIAVITKVKGEDLLFVGSQSGLYKFEKDKLSPIEIPSKNYTHWPIAGFIIGILAIVIILLALFRYQKRQLKNRLTHWENIIKKNLNKDLINKKNDLDLKWKNTNMLKIWRLKKEIDDFENRTKGNLLTHDDIIRELKKRTEAKITELQKYEIAASNENCRKDWENILSIKENIDNEENNNYTFDCALGLLDKISTFEKDHCVKTIITPKMTESQKKDFDKLYSKFSNALESVKNKTKTSETVKTIKEECDNLLNKYRQELQVLNLKKATEKAYIALLFLSGNHKNANIEDVMGIQYVGQKKHELYVCVKKIEKRNAILEQLYENVKTE